MFSYSFWADEAYIASIAQQLVQNNLSLSQALNAPGVTYQRLHMLTITLFFRVFGVNEFAARLPSILGFLLGIIAIFYLARRLSNIYGGILASFLYTFSHLNLSYAFQAKPYITIETILLVIIYLLTDKKKINHLAIMGLCTVATLLHNIGVFLWVIYIVVVISKFVSLGKVKLKPMLISVVLLLVVIGGFIHPTISDYLKSSYIFKYNNLYQIIKLFSYKYSLISIFSLVGFAWIVRRNTILHLGILIYGILVFIMVAFVAYTFPIRYVLTFFGILFLYFGIFWAKVGERYDTNLKLSILNLKLSGKALIPLTVLLLLYATGYKIVRLPQAYYNPNIDKYGDVQIADYKDFYSKLKTRFPQYKKLYVVNNIFDVEAWYFGRYSNAYFTKFTYKPHQHHTADAMIYGSLTDFKKIMAQHPQGLLIMEDWQSFLPDDVKEYAKKNLKLEFRVESLKEAPDDPWPLALYSWGL